MVTLVKRELSYPSDFPEVLRSNPGTGSIPVLPQGPPSPTVLHKEFCCAGPLLSSGGAKPARSKLQ